ncbi:MAG: asparagine synthase-related protein, partial [Mycobacteriaceae bacterium]
ANSLEARSPFLDHQLMEMAARLPVTAKVDGTTKKAALKSAMRGRLPDDLLDRPKWGFSVPLADWLRGPLRGMLRDVLLDPRLRARGQLRSAPIESLISEHVEGHIDRAFELWHLVILELWQRHFIDGEPVGTLLSA